MNRKYGSLVSLSPHVCFLTILTIACRIDKRKVACLFLLSLKAWFSAVRSCPHSVKYFGSRRNELLAVGEINQI